MKSPLQKHIQNIKSGIPKPKVIREYYDDKRRCIVKVLEGVKDVPFKSIPVGGGE